jgi:hypothetical protein
MFKMGQLKKVKYNGKEYYFDTRLKELRSIAKPFELIEFIPFEKVNFDEVVE